MQESVDDNILTKQYFPMAHMEEKKGLETGLIVAIASSNQCVWGEDKTADV
jgi:hypothetical protein